MSDFQRFYEGVERMINNTPGTESEMVMRIARAISEADVNCEGDYRKLARAAIEAMREPTTAMIFAGPQTFQGITYSGLPSWKAMIDAALNEKSPTAS